MSAARYVVISPVRNEAAYLQEAIRCMAAQTVLPAQWVIVNDGSTDDTGSIIEAAVAKHPWIRGVHRKDRGFRQAGGGVIEAFYDGYSQLDSALRTPHSALRTWDFVSKFDGDLSFSPDYFEQCLNCFTEEPRLGIGGGTICNQLNGALEVESKIDPVFHVRGATKIYRRECWDQIGGLIRAPGWDTVDEVKANMLGWASRTFPDLKLIHHRPAGQAYGQWSNLLKNGRANYVAGYHPLFMLLKCARRLFEKPYVVEGVGLWFGFISGYIRSVPQVPDREVIKYFRRQQMNRLLGKGVSGAGQPPIPQFARSTRCFGTLSLHFAVGDFLLSLGAADEHALGKAAEFLRFFPDMWRVRFDYPQFSLLLTSSDNEAIWAPFVAPDKSLLVALAGRVALDQKQWDAAAQIAGPGGLACKFISGLYSASGIAALEALSGNFVILVFDRPANKLFLVTDRWGLFPAFRFQAASRQLSFGSHPDALADAVGESRNWDLTSFGEFILTGKLSSPFSYYQRIKALPVASTVSLDFASGNALPAEQTRTYFEFKPQPQTPARIEELAERFAIAWRQAVGKRTLPLFGQSAVALSGGLDSRTVLCASPHSQGLLAFSFYDTENLEFRIAKSIAQAAGIQFVPLKRAFDYYGDHAALGVRISAGMGCIASNHFLGFRSRLREFGVQNLLTGCYCDYLFKGLALNKRVNRWTTRERLNRFDFSYYFGHYSSSTELALQVRRRLEAAFPAELRRYDSDAVVHTVEARRMFPLAYEEDNAERTIPQRVMGWYVPIADNDLMDVMQNMSCAMKLNRSLFAKTVRKICGDVIADIPDANTGVPVNASVLREACAAHLQRAGHLLAKLKPSNATNGSWLNWGHYLRESAVVQALWSAPNAEAMEVFRQVLGRDSFSPDLAAYDGRRVGLFLQLFTLKLWFDQRRQ